MSPAQEFPSEVLLSIQEAANFLKVNPMTLRRWETRGLLISQRTIGNQRRYTFSQLLEFKKRKYSRNTQSEFSELWGFPSLLKKTVLVSLGSLIVLGGVITVLTTVSTSEESPIAFATGQAWLRKKVPPVIANGVKQSLAFLGIASSPAAGGTSRNDDKSAVLAESTLSPNYLFRVRIPSQFDGVATFKDNIILGNKKLEAGTINALELTAGNVIYSVKAGDGISISSGQNPIITNAANIFKTIKVGSTTFSAGSLTDALTLAAGTGISLSSDTSNKKVTITNSQTVDMTTSGWTDGGTSLYLTTSSDNVGIGTSTPSSFKLQLSGNIGPSATDTYNLGSSSLEWNNIYDKNIYASGNLISPTSGTSGYWQRASGSVIPTNITDDLILGAAATSSALIKFTGTSGNNSWINTGNLGIGTTSPSNSLHVAGTGALVAPSSGTGTALTVRAAPSGSSNIFEITNNAGTSSYFSINSSGQLTGSAFKLTDVNNAIVGTAIEGGWAMNSNTYTFRRIITVTNNDSSTTLPVNYEITVSLSGNDASQVYNASQSNYKDVRMAYGSTEIPMNITTFTSSSVVFTFVTQATIAASSSDATYYLYYRNTSLATSGSTYTSGTVTLDNANTVANWTTGNATNLPIAQETTTKNEGTGSVKIGPTVVDSTVGNVGTWSTTTASIPTAGSNVTTVGTFGGTTYFYNFTAGGTYRGTIGSNGDITSLSTSGQSGTVTLTSVTNIVLINGTYYAYGLSSNTVYKITFDSSGNVTAVTSTGQGQPGQSVETPVIAQIGETTYMYLLGGCCSPVSDAVFKATVDSSGNVGSWSTSGQTQLPQSRYSHQTVIATLNGNTYIYLLGGDNSGYPTTSYKNSINSSGDISGTWTSFTAPGLDQFGVTIVDNEYIYVLGGFNGATLDTVYKSKLLVMARLEVSQPLAKRSCQKQEEAELLSVESLLQPPSLEQPIYI